MQIFLLIVLAARYVLLTVARTSPIITAIIVPVPMFDACLCVYAGPDSHLPKYAEKYKAAILAVVY